MANSRNGPRSRSLAAGMPDLPVGLAIVGIRHAVVMPAKQTPPAGGPNADLSKVRALGLDTNAFPNGQLNIASLGRLVRRAAAHGGVEVWVPEVVLWEWAAHAAAERQAAVNALEAIRATGLPLPPLPLINKQDVLKELEEAVRWLGPPLHVLETRGVAADALRDQVLVEGPAKIITARDGRTVKTGAADSAVLRALLARAAQETASFALVSADKDVERACKEWGLKPPALFKTVTEASKAVFSAVPSDAQVQASCLTLLATEIDGEQLGRLEGDVVADLYDDYTSEVANEESYADEGRQVVGISEVLVDRDGGVATGTAHLLAAVTAAGVVQDTFGDSTVTRWSEAVGASVRIPVTFELDGDQPAALSVEAGEGIVARPAPDDYIAAEDAFQDVIACLQTLPGASDLEWDEPAEDQDSVRTVRLPDGRTLRLTFTGNVFDAWEVVVDLDGSLGTVGCGNLNDGLSDREGFEIPNHYGLWSDIDIGFVRFNPVWAVNAVVIGPPEVDWLEAQNPHA